MKRWFALFLCTVLLFGAMAGCAAHKSEDSAQAAPAAPAPAEMPAADSGSSGVTQEADKSGWNNGSGGASAGGATSDNASNTTAPEYGGHKIIKTAAMGLETVNLTLTLRISSRRSSIWAVISPLPT